MPLLMSSQKAAAGLRLAALLLAVLSLAACGYSWRGQEGARFADSVLGAGDKTLRIVEVEHSTLYPWLPHVVRSEIRDDMNARGLAVWKDSSPTDFTLRVRVPAFHVRSYNEYKEQALLYTATIQMEFIVLDGKNNTEVWRSGLINYSEQYESADEDQAIRESLTQAIRRCMDDLQQRF